MQENVFRLKDQHQRLLKIHADYHIGGTTKLTLYSKYWIVNHTRMRVLYRSVASGEEKNAETAVIDVPTKALAPGTRGDLSIDESFQFTVYGVSVLCQYRFYDSRQLFEEFCMTLQALPTSSKLCFMICLETLVSGTSTPRTSRRCSQSRSFTHLVREMMDILCQVDWHSFTDNNDLLGSLFSIKIANSQWSSAFTIDTVGWSGTISIPDAPGMKSETQLASHSWPKVVMCLEDMT